MIAMVSMAGPSSSASARWAFVIIQPHRRSPWQNPHAERLIGSIRRKYVDHLIVFGEAHLRRLLRVYAVYYNSSRTHRALNQDAPIHRTVQTIGTITSRLVLGGLHHQYCQSLFRHTQPFQYPDRDTLDARPCKISIGPRLLAERLWQCVQQRAQLQLRLNSVSKPQNNLIAEHAQASEVEHHADHAFYKVVNSAYMRAAL